MHGVFLLDIRVQILEGSWQIHKSIRLGSFCGHNLRLEALYPVGLSLHLSCWPYTIVHLGYRVPDANIFIYSIEMCNGLIIRGILYIFFLYYIISTTPSKTVNISGKNGTTLRKKTLVLSVILWAVLG